MGLFIQDSTFLGDHASDADSRKGSDPTEAPKHYIDLENIPAYASLSRNLDSLIQIMGQATVEDNGTLPWATADTYDSLVAQLSRNDMTRALSTASDLGHYVADGHQPLHVTVNYNGQLTGNSGIHSRYETTMINTYESDLTVTPATVQYINDPFAFVLAYCIQGNVFADSIMQADDAAKLASGWSGSGSAPASYYAALWEHTKNLTLDRMQKGTEALASLWYSAWVDAGLLSVNAVTRDEVPRAMDPVVVWNYPNPFNPTTTIAISLLQASDVTLKVFDLQGREVGMRQEGVRPRGKTTLQFDGKDLPSGVYVLQVRCQPISPTSAGVLVRSRTMVLVK
jgi:hypothetical protein